MPFVSPSNLARCLLPVSALLLSIGVAHADIYKYVDENGRTTFSNVPVKGAQKLDLGVYNSVPAPRTHGGAPSSGVKAAPVNLGPSDFPNVDSGTQRKRDNTRRGILENELQGEEKLLADARRAYDEAQAARPGEDAGKRQERAAKLRESVGNHEANIKAIKKELNNVR